MTHADLDRLEALARSLAARPQPWTGVEQDGVRILLVHLADELRDCRRRCGGRTAWPGDALIPPAPDDGTGP